MIFVRGYVGALVVFLAIDLVWIDRVVRPMYDEQIGGLLRAEPRIVPAALFYLLYTAGIVYFAVRPALESGRIKTALRDGALFGGLAYGTYAFTNHAVLEGWTLALVAADVAWGATLTAVAAIGGLLAAGRKPTPGRVRSG